MSTPLNTESLQFNGTGSSEPEDPLLISSLDPTDVSDGKVHPKSWWFIVKDLTQDTWFHIIVRNEICPQNPVIPTIHNV